MPRLGKEVNKHGGSFTSSSACFDSKRHESAAATAEEAREGSFLSLHVQKWILCDKMVSMACRLKFLDAMITPVVCFGAGHRKIYTNFLRDLARGKALASPPQIPRCIGACLATPLGPYVDHCGPTLPLAAPSWSSRPRPSPGRSRAVPEIASTCCGSAS